MAKYKNTWFSTGGKTGPEFYETEATPNTVGRYLVYERIMGKCFDVVINDECVAQRAGLRGALDFIRQHEEGRLPISEEENTHGSDCAIYNEPYRPAGKCDCGFLSYCQRCGEEIDGDYRPDGCRDPRCPIPGA